MANARPLALIGDSILDNSPYTGPDPDITQHLHESLSPEWAVVRVARDGAVMSDVADIADRFAARYAEVAAQAASRVDRPVLCTIYEPPLFDPVSARLASVPLGVLNDRIVRIATQLGLDVLDVRSVCTETSDFVRQIEPSAAGARKVAVAIAALVRGTNELTSARVIAWASHSQRR